MNFIALVHQGGTVARDLRTVENEVMKYPVALTQTDEGFSVSCPGLPGCWSQGATEEEALANIGDEIREYLAVVRELAAKAEIREVDVLA